MHGSSLPGISPEADDSALIAAAQGGDRGALDRLLRRHYDLIFAVCRRLAGNDADALDATQEAMIAIVRGLPRFDGRAQFATWAYRVATNACLDELRRRSRRPVAALPDVEAEYVGGPPTLDVAVTNRLDIDEALSRLPVEFRAAVVLRDVCQLDYAEIAEVLGVPPGTVRSRIARGRAALARDLGNPDPADERPSERS
jgi:RNA polymerase sigma-70 factor (ECF subfamily)